jgi:YD repeat-containing protein
VQSLGRTPSSNTGANIGHVSIDLGVAGGSIAITNWWGAWWNPDWPIGQEYESQKSVSANSVTFNPSPPSEGSSCNAADLDSPVNLSSGNLFDTIDVLSIPGVSPGVDLTFSYNSTESSAGSLGPGWTHSYAMNVAPGAPGFLFLKEEDGRRIVLTESSPGTYIPKDEYGRTGTTLQKYADGSYRMTRKDGSVFDFNTSGILTQITGRSGNALTLAYTGTNLTTLTDAYGRMTRLGYSGNRLETVTDPAGRVTTIGYDPNGYLRAVTDAAHRTTSYRCQWQSKNGPLWQLKIPPLSWLSLLVPVVGRCRRPHDLHRVHRAQ